MERSKCVTVMDLTETVAQEENAAEDGLVVKHKPKDRAKRNTVKPKWMNDCIMG